MRIKMLPALTCAVLATVGTAANAQVTALIGRTGDGYGITAWYGLGRQVNGGNDVGSYGANIKISKLKLFRRGIDSVGTTKRCNECTKNMEVITKYDTTYYLRLGFGLGYLAYFDLRSSITALDAKFDLNGPYAALHATIPLYCIDPDFGLVLGYTGSVVSAQKVLGTYQGADTIGGRTRLPVQFDVPTTFTHEGNIGFSYGGVIFLEWCYNAFKAKNVLYAPMGKDVPADTLQTALKGDLDLSFQSIKLGVSLDF